MRSEKCINRYKLYIMPFLCAKILEFIRTLKVRFILKLQYIVLTIAKKVHSWRLPCYIWYAYHQKQKELQTIKCKQKVRHYINNCSPLYNLMVSTITKFPCTNYMIRVIYWLRQGPLILLEHCIFVNVFTIHIYMH